VSPNSFFDSKPDFSFGLVLESDNLSIFDHGANLAKLEAYARSVFKQERKIAPDAPVDSEPERAGVLPKPEILSNLPENIYGRIEPALPVRVYMRCGREEDICISSDAAANHRLKVIRVISLEIILALYACISS